MEKTVTLLIPALLAVSLLRAMLMPLKLGVKLALHSGCGFIYLWLLNLAAGFTGILIPINAVTALIAGFLGLPGIGLLALLAVI